MRTIKVSVLSIVLIIALLLLALYTFNLKLNQHLETGNTDQEVSQANEKFIKGFFDYKETNQRYKQAKLLMTENGYKTYAFPSGDTLPKNLKIDSSVTDLQSYINADKDSFYNTFTVSTLYNGINTSTQMLIKTKLVHEDNWKVDELDIILATPENDKENN